MLRFGLLLCVCCFLATPGAFAQEKPEVDFARDVRPLLSDRCFACHGPDASKREADLRLDHFDRLSDDRGGYRIIDLDVAEQSELLRRIASRDPDEVMPPPGFGKPLSEEQVQRVRQWVQAGAPWHQHWAYVLPERHPLPLTAEFAASDEPGVDAEEPQPIHWIDAFVLAKLKRAGGQFSAKADRITLARRLAFDLTGLPPDDEVLSSHLDSGDIHEWQSYVDVLLASPAFGERMAVYWLDLVRYADTVGYHGDQDHQISPYRDYVINALNDDLPFDQFTVEQLAGDLLDRPTDEQLAATGYNRLLQTSHEGGVQPKEYLAIYAADRVRNFSAVWMGATVGCAQCHDHKFDPYTATDFYALSAFFADIDEAQHFKLGSNALPTRRPPEKAFYDRATLAALEYYSKQLDDVNREIAVGGESRSDALQTRQQEVEHIIENLRASTRQSMITVSIKPRTVRLLPRGNWLDDSGELLQPAIPGFMGRLANDDRPTRLDLARWLTDPDQGSGLLTARVLVNRLWMLLFGSGLSRSVEDFGGQGEPPDHPELLDRLAIEFVESGWDIKHLIRMIVTSHCYQQSSLETDWHRKHDPTNRLYARQNRFRIDAEMVRDTALACSGLLVREVGGASVRPYQPQGYYRHLNFPVRKYEPSDDAEQWRRGLYIHWQRQFLHPMLRAFDAPTREECTASRSRSNTPLAALVWLNDPSFVEAARALATRVCIEAEHDDASRLSFCFRLATSRKPDAHEQQVLKEVLLAARNEFANENEAKMFLAIGKLEVAATVSLQELAAWTTVARAVLNLSETYTRN